MHNLWLCMHKYWVFIDITDIGIANKPNTNTNSYSNLGYSYTHPDYEYESKEAKSFLAGSFN